MCLHRGVNNSCPSSLCLSYSHFDFFVSIKEREIYFCINKSFMFLHSSYKTRIMFVLRSQNQRISDILLTCLSIWIYRKSFPWPIFSCCFFLFIFFLLRLGLVFWSMLGNLILFTNPSARTGYETRSNFKRSLTGLNSEFSFSETIGLTKAEEPSLPFYLPIAGGRIIEFIPFPGVLVLCEMQLVTSKIWTRVAVSISYNDQHYTTGTCWVM